MIAVVRWIDTAVKKTLTAFCAFFLFLMVVFAVYNIVMRYVFEDPPVCPRLETQCLKAAGCIVRRDLVVARFTSQTPTARGETS